MTYDEFLQILNEAQPDSANKFFMVYDPKNKSMLTVSVRENGKGTFASFEDALAYITKERLVFSGTSGVKLKLPMFKLKKKEETK